MVVISTFIDNTITKRKTTLLKKDYEFDKVFDIFEETCLIN